MIEIRTIAYSNVLTGLLLSTATTRSIALDYDLATITRAAFDATRKAVAAAIASSAKDA